MWLKVTEILYCACFSNKLVAELSYLCEMYIDRPFLDKVILKNTTWVFRLRKTSFALRDELRSQKLLSRWVGSLQPWAVQAMNLNPSELGYWLLAPMVKMSMIEAIRKYWICVFRCQVLKSCQSTIRGSSEGCSWIGQNQDDDVGRDGRSRHRTKMMA